MERLVCQHLQLGNLIQHYYEIVAFYQRHPHWTMGLHAMTPIQHFELMYHVRWNHVDHIAHAPAIATAAINALFCLGNHPFWWTYSLSTRHKWWKEVAEYRLKEIFNHAMLYDVDDNQEGLAELQNTFNIIMNSFRMIDPLVDHYLHNDIPFLQWVQWLDGYAAPLGMCFHGIFHYCPYRTHAPVYYRYYIYLPVP